MCRVNNGYWLSSIFQPCFKQVESAPVEAPSIYELGYELGISQKKSIKNFNSEFT